MAKVEHDEVLAKMKARIAEEGWDVAQWVEEPETVEDLLLRFLTARKFKLEPAMKMLGEDLQWRKEENVAELHQLEEKDVLECSPEVLHYYMPQWVGGQAKNGSIVVYKKYEHCELWKLTPHTSLKSLTRHHIWSMEKYVRLTRKQHKKLGQKVSQITFVLDAKGWYFGMLTRDAFRFLKGLARLDSDHYPERLGHILVINAPWALTSAWKIIRAWLDAKTAEKIRIVRGPKEYEPLLQELIDKADIPTEYGGEAQTPEQLQDEPPKPGQKKKPTTSAV